MCVEPASLSLAVGLISSVVTGATSIAQYQAEADAYTQTVKNAQASARDQHLTTSVRELQEQGATTAKLHEQYLQQAENVSAQEASAAAGNVSGISVDNLVRNAVGRAASNRQAERDQYDATAQQLQLQQTSIFNQEKARIDSAQPASGMTIIGGLAKAAGQAAGAYADYKKATDPVVVPQRGGGG